MCTVAVTIPDEVLLGGGITAGDLARQMAAVGLYARRSVSPGRCSKIARTPEADFVGLLGRFGVSIFHFDGEAEFDGEPANA